MNQNFEELSGKILKKIITFLLPRDVLNLSMTSHFFNDVRVQTAFKSKPRRTIHLSAFCDFHIFPDILSLLFSFMSLFSRHSRFAIQMKTKSGSFSSIDSLAPAALYKITTNSLSLIIGKRYVIEFSCVIDSIQTFII